ncbi:hypothetical protein PtB15_3B90 [Puccinia triticina]|nr:hypothetical protein PtB15_3B90 [Puccinia triticina]
MISRTFLSLRHHVLRTLWLANAGQKEATVGSSFVDWRRGDGIAPYSVCPRPCRA